LGRKNTWRNYKVKFIPKNGKQSVTLNETKNYITKIISLLPQLTLLAPVYEYHPDSYALKYLVIFLKVKKAPLYKNL
jgi:hypothetical protein